MKSLIIGARGLVGSALKKQIPDALLGIPVEPKKDARNTVYIDIAKYETMFKVMSEYRPDVVYLAASIAHVDKCEESHGTDATNIRGPMNLISLCESFNAMMVFYSSSYVFDGDKKTPYKEMDDTNPINHYGYQKKLIETAMVGNRARSLIIRTVGVFGTERLKRNFAKQVIDAIFHGRTVFAPCDQMMNPILSDDLARVTVQLVNQNVTGIVHVAGDTCMTKFEFARKIAGYFGLENLVEPITTKEMNQKAARPVNGCLDCSHLTDIGIPYPTFDGGMLRFLIQEYNEDGLMAHMPKK